jgi:hypothetical protein
VKFARLATYLGRWPIALACAFVLGALALLPGLGDAGLWEPQERQIADKYSPRRELMKISELNAPVHAAVAAQLAPKPPNAQPPPPPPDASCLRAPPPDAVARSLTTRAIQMGRDTFGDSDAGRRLPLALLGLLTVLATFGIAMRTTGPRGGVLAALIALSMPLLALQSRQLTSEIGTAAGGALIIYGMLAIGSRGRCLACTIADNAVAALSLAAGVALAFAGGGALLGLLAPIGGFAAAGALGAPGVRRVWSGKLPAIADVKAFVCALAAIAIIAWLAYQLYDLILLWDLEPNHPNLNALRSIGDHAVVPSRCWSSALGAIWKPEDDLRFIYDSTFEQIAYGTYPWGILAPFAMFALVASKDAKRRTLGALALAWAGGAWIAGEAFQRRVGFTLYAGFPAIAAAVGGWLDGVLTDREQDTRPASTLLLGTFTALAALDLGKDLQSFSERLTSLAVGSDAIPYPTMAHIAWLPAKLWVLLLGGTVMFAFADHLFFARSPSPRLRKVGNVGLAWALGGTVVLAAFWPYMWQGRLSEHLSAKAMFDTVEDLRGKGDQLVMMGELGDAPYDYAPDLEPEKVTTREQVVQALGRPNRVFAISPQTELCQLHRELAGKPYFVIDDRNTRSILLSNKVDGTTDKNPLATQIVHAEPKNIPHRPKGRVVFDGRIELLGWDMPKAVGKGDKFNVTFFYKVLQPVGGNWKVLMHFDGSLRFNGDHDPIGGRCQTSTWQPGDFIVDSYTVIAGGGTFQTGNYEVWTGFFTGSNPNWKNMTVSEAPGDLRDNADRVKVTSLTLE